MSLAKESAGARQRIHNVTTCPDFLRGACSTYEAMLTHEDKFLQEKALKLIPETELILKAEKRMCAVRRAVKNGFLDSEIDVQNVLILELLEWFKNSFFSWVDSPKCRICQGDTAFHGVRSNFEGVNHVEVFSCKLCNGLTFFPRYKNTEKLLETRRGRCQEWAQCFTLMARSLGWETRCIYDVTDHLWVEVFSTCQQQWIHCDPCENTYDKPLLYETGWKKKLSYVIAISYDDVQDVTWRYTCNFSDVLQRRKLCTEKQLLDSIVEMREAIQRDFSSPRKKYLKKRMIKELAEFLTPPKVTGEELGGRTSGSLVWRLARGETSKKVTHVWTPNTAEVTAHMFNLKYSCEKDKYYRGISSDCCISGWQNGVFDVESVFRKEEKDWKMFYLSRTEGSDRGTVKWKFDFSSSGLVIKKVQVVFVRRMFENGVAKVSVTGDRTSVELNSGESTITTKVFEGSRFLIVAAELSGGTGPAAWQHAQLFREQAGSSTCPFSIDIQLREV